MEQRKRLKGIRKYFNWMNENKTSKFCEVKQCLWEIYSIKMPLLGKKRLCGSLKYVIKSFYSPTLKRQCFSLEVGLNAK